MAIYNKETNMIELDDKDKEDVNLIRGHNPRISESIFKDYFVQMLIDGYPNAPEEIQTRYLQYAGKLTTPVDIVDDTGTVILTSPAIINTDVARQGKFSQKMSAAAAQYNNEAQRSRAIGDAFINREVPGIAASIEGDNSYETQARKVVDYFIEKYPPNTDASQETQSRRKITPPRETLFFGEDTDNDDWS